MVKNIGILALQGNYQQNFNILSKLNCKPILVKYSKDLDCCDALIIPGGESTVMSIQIKRNNLKKSIINFANEKSVFGICAGMVMLSQANEDFNVDPLAIMSYSVNRNAWGRQISSFVANIDLEFDNKSFEGLFIRAPKFKQINENVTILATYKKEPVMVSEGKHFACSFHPEISTDNIIFSYFLDNIYE